MDENTKAAMQVLDEKVYGERFFAKLVAEYGIHALSQTDGHYLQECSTILRDLYDADRRKMSDDSTPILADAVAPVSEQQLQKAAKCYSKDSLIAQVAVAYFEWVATHSS